MCGSKKQEAMLDIKGCQGWLYFIVMSVSWLNNIGTPNYRQHIPSAMCLVTCLNNIGTLIYRGQIPSAMCVVTCLNNIGTPI